MKKIILAMLVVFISISVKSQESKLPIKLKDVVWLKDSTTKSKDEYNRAKLFFADEYRSAKDVITFDDANTFTVIGRGWIDLKSKNIFHKYAKLWHTIKIECKDGRYRYELSDMKVEIAFSGYYGGTQTSTTGYVQALTNIKEMKDGRKKDELIEIYVKPVENIIERLNTVMNSTHKDNW